MAGAGASTRYWGKLAIVSAVCGHGYEYVVAPKKDKERRAADIERYTNRLCLNCLNPQ